MRVDELQQLIADGENALVELKSALPPESELSKLLSAFANGCGGTLIVGVSDDGAVPGLPIHEALHLLERLKDVAKSIVSVHCNIGTVHMGNDRHVVTVRVDPSPDHLRPVRTASGVAYQRIGSTTRELSVEHVYRHSRDYSEARISLFVAMSFRSEAEPALVDYFEAIKRATDKIAPKIALSRMDLSEGDYEISQQIMEHIDRAQIVLTDFTLSSSNVYFELGYARGKRKRVIQTARAGTELEFDIRNWRTVFYRNATELEIAIGPALQQAVNDILESDA